MLRRTINRIKPGKILARTMPTMLMVTMVAVAVEAALVAVVEVLRVADKEGDSKCFDQRHMTVQL